jgi:transglutaminase-like putative cysteine protease
MASLAPNLSPGRGGLRMGLWVFAAAALFASGVLLGPLIWSPPRATDAATVQAPDRIPFPPFDTRASFPTPNDGSPLSQMPSLAAIAITNLTASTGAVRMVASTNLPSIRGIAAAGLPRSGTNRNHRARGEPAVFAALRASRNQPVPKEVADLAKSITRDCKTDADRARAIYDWMTGHITYDWKVWADIVAGATAYTEPQDPASVIARGTAVCAGYAWLFDALAASAGMEATFVIGDVRGYRGTADDSLVSPYLHAWNSVRIDDTWYLLDSTWGARQNGESATDYLARRDYYFETPAKQMIFDHLPENDDWQLLANPISSADFQSLPNLKPAFFRDGLRLGNAFADTLSVLTSTACGITLVAPETTAIAATLTSNARDISAGNIVIRESGVRRDIVLAPLPAGEYILRIYSKQDASNAPYECAIDYVVKIAGK